MSDNWTIIIPEDPLYVPATESQERARRRLEEIAPNADEVNVHTTKTVVFFDCGGNFERIRCPSCGSEIPTDWWKKRMDDDYDAGFRLAEYAVPCCGVAHTLHELTYESPQGFGRFSLKAMNPGIGRLDDAHREEFEKILGGPLRVIYQHI